MNPKSKIFIRCVTALLIITLIVKASPHALAKQQDKPNQSGVTDVHGLSHIIDIAYDGSSTNTVALQEDGTIWYWLGGGKAKQGPTIKGAIKVTAGTLVLKQDGTVWEWDKNTYQVSPVAELKDIISIQSDRYNEVALALDKNHILWVRGDSIPASMVLGKVVNADTTAPEPQPEVNKALKFERGIENIQTMTLGRSGDIGIVKQDGAIEHYYHRYGYPEMIHGKFTYRLQPPLAPQDIHLQVIFDRFNDGYLDLITVVANDGSVWYGSEEKTLKRFYEPKVKLVASSGSPISRGAFSELYALDEQKTLLGIEMLGDKNQRYYAKTIKYDNVKNVKKVISRLQNSGIVLKEDGTVWQWGQDKNIYADYLMLDSLEAKIKLVQIEKEITVRWNGQAVLLFSQPVMKKSLMVPMRELFEMFGSNVQYNDGNIIVQQGNKRIKLKVYSHDATVDGKKVKLTEAPTYIDGKTYVPLRFVAQALGADVAWNAKEQVVAIKYSK